MADRELGFLRAHPELRAPLRRGFKAELAKVPTEREAEESNSVPHAPGQTNGETVPAQEKGTEPGPRGLRWRRRGR
jgi:hypothetical protein